MTPKTPKQLDLFNRPSFHTITRDIKSAMNQAIKKSNLKREQVLDLMNDLAERRGVRMNGKGGLSKDTFEKWLNVEEESRMPGIKGLTIFCAVLGTASPLEPMTRLLGHMIIEGNDIAMLEWARRYHKTKDLRKQMRKLEEEIS
ncbi:MAG: hypothetical protein OEY01_10895 [Desulfobulbaceae bacterium]|nr:hypothetical protein [Desulfobulbaceae bacterium]